MHPPEPNEIQLQQQLEDRRRALPRTYTPEVGVKGADIARLSQSIATAAASDAAAARRSELMALQERQRRERLGLFVERFGIPPEDELRDVVLSEHPIETHALRAFAELVEFSRKTTRRRALFRVVGGPPGTGKTAAMAWALVRLGDDLFQQTRDVSALFVPAGDIAATPRNGFSTNADTWQMWLTTRVLGIDDAGTELGDTALLVYLMEERYNRALTTLVTTNLKRSTFGTRYPSDRLADRLGNGQERAGGPGGLPWYVVAKGQSLRDPAARAALSTGRGAP